MLFLFPSVYIICSAVIFIKAKWPFKLLLAIIAAAATAKTKLYALIGPDWFTTPDALPRPIVQLLTLTYGIAIIFLFLLMLTDALQALPIIIIAFRRRRFLTQIRFFREILHAALLALAIALGTAGFCNATALPEIHRNTLQIPNLNPNADGTTIAFLADLHADPFFPPTHLRDIVEMTNSLKPDFILLGGDYVDGSIARRAHILDPLADLAPAVATLAIPGNHEYYSGYTDWKPVLQSFGITILDNAHADFPEHGIAICGVTDPGARRFGLPQTDLDAATSGIPKNLTRILLAHRPGIAHDAAKLPADRRPAIQLSGHTHGGMFPGLNLLVAHVNGGFHAGAYQLDGMRLFVSTGTAIWNGFPIRLFCPPEILLFTFKKG